MRHSIVLAFAFTVLAPMSVQAQTTWYVDGSAQGGTGRSWAQAFATLDAALAACGSGDEVWVAQGRYVSASASGFALPGDAILRGGFAGGETRAEDADPLRRRTVLDGDVLGDDLPAFGNRSDNLSNVAVGAVAAGEALIIDGFFVRGGQARGPLRDTGPSGMRVISFGGTVEVRRCVFTENDGGDAGGALGLVGPPNGGPAATRVVDCRFTHNRSLSVFGGMGGAIVCGAGTEIRGCSFVANSAPLGGAIDTGPGAAIVDCEFLDNFSNIGGSAIRAVGALPTPVHVLHCRFLGNRSTGSGTVLVDEGPPVEIAGCEFSGNSATFGAAVHARATSAPFAVTVVSCTATANIASSAGGGISTTGPGSLTVDNTILYANVDAGSSAEDAQLALSATTIAGVRTSCVEGLQRFAGNGNLGSAPRLVDARGFDQIPGTPDDDLRVAIDSPCLEAGDYRQLPADRFDLDGDGDRAEFLPVTLEGTPRVLNQPGIGPPSTPWLDIGAHEGPRIPLPGTVFGAAPRFAIALGVDDVPAADPAPFSSRPYPSQLQVPRAAQRVRVRLVTHAVAAGTPLVLAAQFLPLYSEPQLTPQLPGLQLSLASPAFYLPTTVSSAGLGLPEDSFAVPAGLGGSMLRLQAFALGATTIAAISDASEFYFD